MRRRASALAAGALLATAGCGASKTVHATPQTSGSFAGELLDPPQPEQPIALRDYRGRRVELSQYRGKAVLLTFLYTHCPDVCPAIAGELSVALDELGARSRDVQVIAVSADPRRDTPQAIARFVRAHHLAGRIEYLTGSSTELARVWAEWHIAARPDAQSNLVAHSALVYGITAGGAVVTIYPANARPSDLAHDVPKLAAT